MQHIHLEVRIMKDGGILLFLPLPGAIKDDLSKGLLQVQLLPHQLPLNLYSEEVYITSLTDGYF